MKITWHRLILDFIMLVGIASLYSENAVSMSYHEIGGLVLFGLFLLHLIFNRKWIKSVFVKLFSRGILLRTRILCVVDILLLVCWAMVIVSGACISKVVFSFRVYGQWKMLHFFFAALSLVLSGIHLGLHIKYFDVHLKKICPLPSTLKKILIAVLAIAIVIVGAVNYNSSGLGRWLSMPFGSAMGGGPSGEMGGTASGEASREIEIADPASDSAAESSGDPAEEETVSEKAPSPVIPVYGVAAEETASEEPVEETETSGEMSESTGSGEMRGGPSGEMHGMGFRPGRLLSLVWEFGTVVLAVMTITGAVDALCAWAKRRIRSNRKK